MAGSFRRVRQLEGGRGIFQDGIADLGALPDAGEFARLPDEKTQVREVRGSVRVQYSVMPDYESLEDEQLVSATLDGDLNAFDEVVRRHQTMITRCLFRFCPHQSDLEDLVQMTFVKAYRKIESWQATAPFENWLRKIAYNTGYDFYRKNSRNPASISKNCGEENENTLARLAEPETHRKEYEVSEQAHQALALLNAEERMLLTLQYLEEMPLQEIADQMGWGLSKTKVKSFRARKKLKKLLIKNGIVEESEPSQLG